MSRTAAIIFMFCIPICCIGRPPEGKTVASTLQNLFG
jgi:hypothetical protein